MRLLQAKGVGELNDEVAHRPWRHQRVAALGLREPRQVNRQQMSVLCQPMPGGLVAVNALRPRTQQERVIIARLTLGVANGEAIQIVPLQLPKTRPHIKPVPNTYFVILAIALPRSNLPPRWIQIQKHCAWPAPVINTGNATNVALHV